MDMAVIKANFVAVKGQKLTGNISHHRYDVDFIGEKNPKSGDELPLWLLYSKTPLGRYFECGAIYERVNPKGVKYLSIIVETGNGNHRFYGKLWSDPADCNPDCFQVQPQRNDQY